MKNKEVETLVKLLTEKGWHIVTMESCTGGALANAITNVPGASAVIKDSFITYSNEAKIKLGVPAELIDKYTVYSLPVAEAMAKQAIANSVTDHQKIVGVGITGSLTREDPNNPNSEPGKVYIAICVSGSAKGNVNFSYGIIVNGDDREKGKEEVLEVFLKLTLDSVWMKLL